MTKPKMKDGLMKRGNTWSYVARIRDPKTGVMKPYWVGGFATQTEARRARDDTRDRVHKGTAVVPASILLSRYLDGWLKGVEPKLGATTFASYKMHVKLHIVPALGHHRLQAITGDMVNGFYADLLKEGRKRTCKDEEKDKARSHKKSSAPKEPAPAGLSPNTVRRIAATLHRAFRDAVKAHILPHNPVSDAELPKVTAGARDRQVWTIPELATFLQSVRSDPMYPLFCLAARTGMRRGELVGIRWSDLDLNKASLSVRRALVVVEGKVREGDPKTRKSRRSIPLDAETVAALRSHRKAQAAERLAFAGAAADTGYVFTQEDGQPLHPDYVGRCFESASKRAGMTRIRLHDLRHTFASLMLANGVPMKVVSERLGHSTVAFTMEVYQHVMPGMQEDATDRFAALLAAQAPPA
jgi:integrase